MFEDSFFQLLQQYPGATADRKKFVGLTKDLFPEQQMQINLLVIAFDLGITEALKKTNRIDNAFAFRFVKRLQEEYGISRINADWAISVWCVCYGKKLLHKDCDFEISKASSGAAPAILDEQKTSGKAYNDLFQYRIISDGYGISGFLGDNARTLIFPNLYQGKPVTSILADAFNGCQVHEAVITDGIISIGKGAFKGCQNLKQIILPATLRIIDDNAFAECCNLTTVALPSKLEQIGRNAFAGTAIRQLTLPEGLLWLGEGAYMNCQKLSSVQLPEIMSELPASVFKGCSELKKMTLPDKVQTIGKETFAECSSLIDMIIPESVSVVGDNAFIGTSSDFRLICTQNSAAETYARKYNVPFQIVL